MIKKHLRRFFGGVFLAIHLLPLPLLAHAAAAAEVAQNRENIKIIRFTYSTNDPMAYAKVKVYPPSKPNVEAIKSFTDRNGYFAFLPDENGEWVAEAFDGMGHTAKIAVNSFEVSQNSVEDKNIAAASKTFKIVLALSLILNIYALYGLATKSFIFKRTKS
jgi:nickel transport protein